MHARLLHGAALRLFLTLLPYVFPYRFLYLLFQAFLYIFQYSFFTPFHCALTPPMSDCQRQVLTPFTGTSGNRSVKTVRFPGSLDALAAPPCKAMMVRTMARPRPLEPLALLREGSAR